MLPLDERAEDVQPEEEAKAQAARGESDRDLAGTLRAPWRWEDLIVEAAVIGRLDRWQRRLKGLEHEYDRRVREASSEDPDASRVRALVRDREQLRALRGFAEPILAEMAEWPHTQTWGDWLSALERLAPRVIAKPERVLRMLRELAPLSAVGPVSLREVRDVLTPRLSTLTHEPPRRRHGRVFVGTPSAARGRSFRVVFVPGLAERMFPQKIREDALLPDERREAMDAALATQTRRAADERLQLTLAVGAAAERLYVSYPRVELNESRQRVPSFYVLDIARAIEGHIPPASMLAARASDAGGATLAWPAPLVAGNRDRRFRARPVDDGGAAAQFDRQREGPRALSVRAQPRAAAIAHVALAALASEAVGPRRRHRAHDGGDAAGARRPTPRRPAVLADGAAALLRMSVPVPDGGGLSAGAARSAGAAAEDGSADARRSVPPDAGRRPATDCRRTACCRCRSRRLPAAQQRLTAAIREVHDREYDRLSPAIDRVWQDEIAAMTQDLREWLEKLADGRRGVDAGAVRVRVRPARHGRPRRAQHAGAGSRSTASSSCAARST